MTPPVVETVTLEEFEFGVRQLLSQHFATEARIRKDMALHLGQAIEYSFVQTILGKNLEKIEAKYPHDWCEAFKDRWFPKWVKRRWPIKYNTLMLRADVYYPMIPIRHEQHHLKLSLSETFDRFKVIRDE